MSAVELILDLTMRKTPIALIGVLAVALWMILLARKASKPVPRAMPVAIRPYRTAPVTIHKVKLDHGTLDHYTLMADFYSARDIAVFTHDMTGHVQKLLTLTRAAVITGGSVSHLDLTGKEAVMIPDGGVSESTIYVPGGMISVRGPVQNAAIETAAGWIRAGVVRSSLLQGKFIDAMSDSSCKVMKIDR